jgi:hypothetical protein
MKNKFIMNLSLLINKLNSFNHLFYLVDMQVSMMCIKWLLMHPKEWILVKLLTKEYTELKNSMLLKNIRKKISEIKP